MTISEGGAVTVPADRGADLAAAVSKVSMPCMRALTAVRLALFTRQSDCKVSVPPDSVRTGKRLWSLRSTLR